ncbi:hypothetical protein IscW_ISCW023792, partial [Ixodes scapularis]
YLKATKLPTQCATGRPLPIPPSGTHRHNAVTSQPLSCEGKRTTGRSLSSLPSGTPCHYTVTTQPQNCRRKAPEPTTPSSSAITSRQRSLVPPPPPSFPPSPSYLVTTDYPRKQTANTRPWWPNNARP